MENLQYFSGLHIQKAEVLILFFLIEPNFKVLKFIDIVLVAPWCSTLKFFLSLEISGSACALSILKMTACTLSRMSKRHRNRKESKKTTPSLKKLGSPLDTLFLNLSTSIHQIA